MRPSRSLPGPPCARRPPQPVGSGEGGGSAALARLTGPSGLCLLMAPEGTSCGISYSGEIDASRSCEHSYEEYDPWLRADFFFLI